MEEKKVLLSVKDLVVKFRVRGRILTAIRGVSLDIKEDECIAIVGESGSGKSVFTKTFAGMLDSNGFIDQGDIIFDDDELADTHVQKSSYVMNKIKKAEASLKESTKLLNGAGTWQEMPGIPARPRTQSRPVPATGHPAAAPAGHGSNPDSYSFSSLPYFAAIIAASLCLALRYWVCEVFSVMPSSRAISRWDSPSRQKRLNTAR